MSKAPPAFQFYPADFVMGTAEMSATEVGCYMLLLCHQWATGSIPDEKGSLSSGLTRICRGENPSHLVMSKFVSDGKGRLFNERLEFERDKQAKYREAQALNGKKGGRPKAKLTQPLTQPLSQPLTDGFALALNRLNPDESSSSSDFSLKTAGAPASTPAVCVLPSASLIPGTEIRILKTDPVLFTPEGRASPSAKTVGARNGYSIDFEQWWSVYPLKVGKGDAWKAWPKAVLNVQQVRSISKVAAVEFLVAITKVFADSPAGNAGRYTPHGSTWLNGNRFDDDTTSWERESAAMNHQGLQDFVREAEEREQSFEARAL